MNAEDLVRQQDRLAQMEASRVFIPGCDRDDALQEARIGLWKAARDFDPRAGSSFQSFARLCIRRQLATAIKTARRRKHLVLTTAVREVAGDEGDESMVAVDNFASPEPGPDAQIEGRESLARVLAATRRLSPLERMAIGLTASGLSYGEVAEDAGRDRKAVDNALQRGRGKLARAWEADTHEPEDDFAMSNQGGAASAVGQAVTKLERLRDTEQKLPAAIDRVAEEIADLLEPLGLEVRLAKAKRAAKPASGEPKKGTLAAATRVDELPPLSRRIIELLPATREWLISCEELAPVAGQGRAGAIRHLTDAGWITTDDETGQLVRAARPEAA